MSGYRNVRGVRAAGWSRLGLLALAAPAVIAGCVLSPTEQAQDPRVLVDVFVIAHSMAVSYGSRPNADPKVVVELARLDARAAQAIRGLAASQRYDDTSETARAVAALANYAAAQELRTP